MTARQVSNDSRKIAEAGCSAACRSSSRAAYLPLPSVKAFATCAATMPAADFCRMVRVNRSTLSPDSGTCGRPPAIRLTAFDAQPPDLQPAPLMDMDFAVIGQLVRRRMPYIRFLSIGSRLCYTLPSDPASRRRPCASLSLLLHQDVKRTYTSKMSFMHGVPKQNREPSGSRFYVILAVRLWTKPSICTT